MMQLGAVSQDAVAAISPSNPKDFCAKYFFLISLPLFGSDTPKTQQKSLHDEEEIHLGVRLFGGVFFGGKIFPRKTS